MLNTRKQNLLLNIKKTKTKLIAYIYIILYNTKNNKKLKHLNYNFISLLLYIINNNSIYTKNKTEKKKKTNKYPNNT